MITNEIIQDLRNGTITINRAYENVSDKDWRIEYDEYKKGIQEKYERLHNKVLEAKQQRNIARKESIGLFKQNKKDNKLTYEQMLGSV